MLSCPYVDLCVGSDDQSEGVSTAFPASGQPWHQTPGYTDTFENDAVSCASPQDCVLASSIGYIDASDDAFQGDWIDQQVAPGDWFTGISCPSTTLCIAVDKEGHVWDSTDPFAPSPQWLIAATPDTHRLEAVTCPSISLCVAVDDGGFALVATDPTGPASSWTVKDIDGSQKLTAIWCGNTAEICIAADYSGRVVTGTISG